MSVNEHRRLASETYSIVIPLADGQHRLDICIARDTQDQVREVNFVTRGKIGGGLDALLHELGIQVSRAIQRRNPQTGEPLAEGICI